MSHHLGRFSHSPFTLRPIIILCAQNESVLYSDDKSSDSSKLDLDQRDSTYREKAVDDAGDEGERRDLLQRQVSLDVTANGLKRTCEQASRSGSLARENSTRSGEPYIADQTVWS